MSPDADQPATADAQLRALLERHPRATWDARATPTVRLWLDVHAEFRRECAALTAAADEYRAARLAPSVLAAIAAIRLRAMVANLAGHHEIEDYAYFPTLRASDPWIGPTLDRLASEHARLDEDVRRGLAALDDLVAAADDGRSADAAAAAAERFASDCESLCRRLARHLGDEEDAVIPLLIERAR